MTLTPSEKKLYFTIWGVVALVAAIWISLKEYRSKNQAADLVIKLEPAISERFSRVLISKKGVDFIELEFELTDSFSKSIVRFPKLLTLGYVLRRGDFDVDHGEFSLNLPPQSASVATRLVNRKKIDFGEVQIHLAH